MDPAKLWPSFSHSVLGRALLDPIRGRDCSGSRLESFGLWAVVESGFVLIYTILRFYMYKMITASSTAL